MTELETEFNTLATAVRVARASKGKAKKQFGKKAPEVKAARKATREAKKVLEAFKLAHPEFAAAKLAPKPPKARGVQLPPPAPVRAPDEVVSRFIGGEWVDVAVPTVKTAAAPTFGEEAFASAQAETTDADALVVAQAPVEVVGEAIPAPAATLAPEAKPASLTARLLNILQAGNVVTPAQAAALLTAEGEAVTAKQAGDALARMAKAGKAAKADGSRYGLGC